MENRLMEKWTSKTGKYWIELYRYESGGYTYKTHDSSGRLPWDEWAGAMYIIGEEMIPKIEKEHKTKLYRRDV